jgi:hypothetical protein
MVAFEQATSLKADEYWIEARPGGAPSWTDNTKIARLAHREGAVYMGWAAHGDICRGFPGETNSEMLRKLERAARQRSGEFPSATHYLLFGEDGEISVREVRSGR